ncbi:MAG: hypothetical protein DMG05_25585 [Acidobacteria bacterium]|nr:MAG: hypothetical protein DMG05_25585 [Acidobacteriota bacterium]
MHDRVMKEYALVPESILNLRELFASWADNTWLPARKIQHKNDLSTTCAAQKLSGFVLRMQNLLQRKSSGLKTNPFTGERL